MAITSDHVTGFIVGLGVASLGFYMYKKNQAQIDEWLRRQSINLPLPGVPGEGPVRQVAGRIAAREGAAGRPDRRARDGREGQDEGRLRLSPGRCTSPGR